MDSSSADRWNSDIIDSVLNYCLQMSEKQCTVFCICRHSETAKFGQQNPDNWPFIAKMTISEGGYVCYIPCILFSGHSVDMLKGNPSITTQKLNTQRFFENVRIIVPKNECQQQVCQCQTATRQHRTWLLLFKNFLIVHYHHSLSPGLQPSDFFLFQFYFHTTLVYKFSISNILVLQYSSV